MNTRETYWRSKAAQLKVGKKETKQSREETHAHPQAAKKPSRMDLCKRYHLLHRLDSIQSVLLTETSGKN